MHGAAPGRLGRRTRGLPRKRLPGQPCVHPVARGSPAHCHIRIRRSGRRPSLRNDMGSSWPMTLARTLAGSNGPAQSDCGSLRHGLGAGFTPPQGLRHTHERKSAGKPPPFFAARAPVFQSALPPPAPRSHFFLCVTNLSLPPVFTKQTLRCSLAQISPPRRRTRSPSETGFTHTISSAVSGGHAAVTARAAADSSGSSTKLLFPSATSTGPSTSFSCSVTAT